MSHSRSYRDLIAWQKAMELVVSVYRMTGALPDEERFGLTSQMRRCAVSIPSNIAEGRGRGDNRDFTGFLTVARGSLMELATQIDICPRLGYTGVWESLMDGADEVRRILQGLIQSRPAR
ncbi:MAG: four helix bundle protein [Planctomycetota bacterium]|nr:four helix bundle protein [Planctomycetota bacterium]